MTVEVHHNQAASRFEAIVDGQLSRADYRLDGKLMQAHHTEVPPAQAGRGIASELVRALFAYASAEGLRVQPACSYVRAWARRHPEVAGLLADAGQADRADRAD